MYRKYVEYNHKNEKKIQILKLNLTFFFLQANKIKLSVAFILKTEQGGVGIPVEALNSANS